MAESTVIKVVTFKLGDEKFATDILLVQEIVREVKVTKVPKSPSFVEGVINLRGKVIPVVDLRKRFDMHVSEIKKENRVIIITIGKAKVGFVVDAVDRVLDIDNSVVDDAPSIVFGVDSKFISGVAKVDNDLILLLDAEKVFSFEEREFLSNVD